MRCGTCKRWMVRDGAVGLSQCWVCTHCGRGRAMVDENEAGGQRADAFVPDEYRGPVCEAIQARRALVDAGTRARLVRIFDELRALRAGLSKLGVVNGVDAVERIAVELRDLEQYVRDYPTTTPLARSVEQMELERAAGLTTACGDRR